MLNCFPKRLDKFALLLVEYKDTIASHLVKMWFWLYFNISHLNGYALYLIVALILTFLITNKIKEFFICVLASRVLFWSLWNIFLLTQLPLSYCFVGYYFYHLIFFLIYVLLMFLSTRNPAFLFMAITLKNFYLRNL